ncbi:MAG TPA: 2-succinyl-5-enolpyruvyl-6-hydroxy-3-cyclohexene-1-carboxylic-acid synthase [Nocardioidaceae bacterium]|nr:2-succinyl-5-enolpyruvyl-6-hydroxy-3-cyclohexene-1-carboxylic-acid synthase [Nocardioidaceae bacterium]
MNPSTALAQVVVDELVRSGVGEVVLAPGSRSAPLAFALHAADGDKRLRLHVRTDERSAGFLALGLARTGTAPAAVVTTSGTAVGNLLPAVMEASHAGVPLLVVTADRPAALRGTGANQTTDQAGIFGRFVRDCTDLPAPSDDPGQAGYWRRVTSQAVLAATGARTGDPGPVHLNLQLVEPLVPEGVDTLPESLQGRPGGGAWTTSPPRPVATPYTLDTGLRTVVVAGDESGPPARALAESAGWPLLAEPTSGARTGGHALRCYRMLLTGRLAEQVERVVVFGHPTLSRPVTRLLSRTDVDVIVVADGTHAWPDTGHTARQVLASVRAAGAADPAWLRAWQRADDAVAAAVDALLAAEPALTPYSVAAAVHAALPPDGLLVVGSSNPIRDLDLMAAPHPVGERRKTIANRGLAGIDGTVSTAIGAALARRGSARAFGYLGDLTFLHDANGLVIGPDEPRPDLTLVVANDDGGSIFGLLEQGAPEHSAAFDRIFGTPHHVDLSSLCAATSTPYQRVGDLPALREVLERPVSGVEVVEVPVDRAGRRDLDRRLREAAESAQVRSSD